MLCFPVAWQPTFCDGTAGLLAKSRLRNERRNSILIMMTCHNSDEGSASDWTYRKGKLLSPIRTTTKIWVVTRHQYGIYALICEETKGGVAKYILAVFSGLF